MAAIDSGRTSRDRDRQRNDAAAAAADDDAAGRQQFAALYDGHSADVAATTGGGADRLASRRANTVCGQRRDCRTVIGGATGGAVSTVSCLRSTPLLGGL